MKKQNGKQVVHRIFSSRPKSFFHLSLFRFPQEDKPVTSRAYSSIYRKILEYPLISTRTRCIIPRRRDYTSVSLGIIHLSAYPSISFPAIVCIFPIHRAFVTDAGSTHFLPVRHFAPFHRKFSAFERAISSGISSNRARWYCSSLHHKSGWSRGSCGLTVSAPS